MRAKLKRRVVEEIVPAINARFASTDVAVRGRSSSYEHDFVIGATESRGR